MCVYCEADCGGTCHCCQVFRNAIKRVEEIHKPYEHEGFTISKRCLECGFDYPCDTIKALDGEQ